MIRLAFVAMLVGVLVASNAFADCYPSQWPPTGSTCIADNICFDHTGTKIDFHGCPCRIEIKVQGVAMAACGDANDICYTEVTMLHRCGTSSILWTGPFEADPGETINTATYVVECECDNEMNAAIVTKCYCQEVDEEGAISPGPPLCNASITDFNQSAPCDVPCNGSGSFWTPGWYQPCP